MRRFSDWNMRDKIFLLLLLSVSALALSLSIFNILGIVSESGRTIGSFRVDENGAVESKLTNMVDVAWEVVDGAYRNSADESYLSRRYGPKLKAIIDVAESIAKEGMADVASGRTSKGEAQRATLARIKALRYDSGTGYIWVNDTGSPYPKMIMHPTSPALDGKVLDDAKYNTVGPEKKNLFSSFVEVCSRAGEGFVKYLWPKPAKDGLTEQQPKLSYVRLLREWAGSSAQACISTMLSATPSWRPWRRSNPCASTMASAISGSMTAASHIRR